MKRTEYDSKTPQRWGDLPPQIICLIFPWKWIFCSGSTRWFATIFRCAWPKVGSWVIWKKGISVFPNKDQTQRLQKKVPFPNSQFHNTTMTWAFLYAQLHHWISSLDITSEVIIWWKEMDAKYKLHLTSIINIWHSLWEEDQFCLSLYEPSTSTISPSLKDTCLNSLSSLICYLMCTI